MNFSIIIPTLNEEILLPRLLNQINDKEIRDLYNFEIIISDGGSKDSTIEIAERNADKLIIHDGDNYQNIAQGRNKGAEAAEGSILIFLNGDILLEDPKDFFSFIKNKFEPGKFLAMTCTVIVNPSETKFIDRVFQTFYNNYFHMLNLINVGMGRGECQVIRKEIFDNLNGYNIKLVAGEDFEFYTRVRKIGKILFARSIKVYESPRRYRKYGHFYIFFSWLLNSIFVLFKKRSLSKKWDEIR